MSAVSTFRFLVIWAIVLLFTGTTGGQIRRQVPAPAQANGDFGSKFFDDLRSLFGKLQKSELERAFQRAKPIHCSDLVGQSGEWREVAFLNDDRKLGDWHFDSIEEVKSDLAAFVFSGVCRDEQSPLKVATSYPVRESLDKFQAGRIPFSQVVISDNDPVSVIFTASTEVYTFQLPYLYVERKNSSGAVYTLTPPLTTSKLEPGVAIEFRCKPLSDAELTYRFLLCRTRLVERNSRIQRQNVTQPLGNAAYYILSDGKEASSSVNLVFGDPEDSREVEDTHAPEARTPPPEPAAGRTWRPATPQARLVEIGQNEIRLRFNAQTWNSRIDKSQLITGEMLSEFVSAPRNKEYCVWRPGVPAQAGLLLDKAAADSILYWLEFRKDRQSASSAVFEMESNTGVHLGALQCYFPQSQTPVDVTVDRWLSIVGAHMALEVHGQ